MEYNVYCDESCHLKSNDSQFILIGAIYCPKNKVKKVNEYIRYLKKNYGFKENFELKWNKVSLKVEKLCLDIINYFFSLDYLNFRVIVIDKNKLDHKKFNQTEDEFYHKSYYAMLRYIIVPGNNYNIYPDIKDTHSYYNQQIILNFLRIKMDDYNSKTIKKIQPIRSYESELLQVVDIFIGALSYFYRNLISNSSKLNIINELRKLYGFSFDETSSYNNVKFNILLWKSKSE